MDETPQTPRFRKLQAGLVLAVEVLVGLVTVSAPYRHGWTLARGC